MFFLYEMSKFALLLITFKLYVCFCQTYQANFESDIQELLQSNCNANPDKIFSIQPYRLYIRKIKRLSPSRRREAPCEVTNSTRLFTPGKRIALAKSKVHQISRARSMGVWVVISLISKYGCLPGVKSGKIYQKYMHATSPRLYFPNIVST